MIFTEKLLDDAKAAIDEAKQYAEDIGRLNQRVRELEEQGTIDKQRLKDVAAAKETDLALRLKVEQELNELQRIHKGLEETLAKEVTRTASLQHEVDRLREKLLKQKSLDELTSTTQDSDRVAKLEAELAKLRRSLENLWNIENLRSDHRGADDNDGEPKRQLVLRSIAWMFVGGIFLWLIVTYMGLLK